MIVVAVATSVALSWTKDASAEGAPPCNEAACTDCRNELYHCEQRRERAKLALASGIGIILGGAAVSATGAGAAAGVYIAAAAGGIALAGLVHLMNETCQPCFDACWGCPSQSSGYG